MPIVFDQPLNTTDSPTFVEITTTGTQATLGNFVFNADQSVGALQDDYILTYDSGTGEIGLEAAPASGATQLSELSDVNTSTPTNRNVLVADGVDFESRALVEADISDLQSYLTTVQLTDLTDVNTSTPTNRNVLVADGVDFESRALVEADISDLGTYLLNVSDDLTPQLGNDLDFNGNGIGHATGASMFYDAVDVLSLRRSTNAQSHRIYNTYGDASNNEYLSIDWSTTVNTATIATVANGTGTNRDIHIAPASGVTQITGTLDVATGTMTTADPGIDLAMTWNSGGTQFKGLDVDITNTASAGGSKPISVTVDSTVEYEMRVGGDHYYNSNTLRQLQNLIADTATNMRLRADAGNAVELQSSTNTIAQANQNGFHFKRTVELQIPGTGSTGDGQAQYLIPEMWNGYNLVGVYAYNGTQSTFGTVDFQIRKVTSGGGGGMGGGGGGGGGAPTGGVDMLSTLLTIDANESDSSTAATAAVIDTANDDVASHDIIKIDIDSVGTGSGDYIIHLDFELP